MLIDVKKNLTSSVSLQVISSGETPTITVHILSTREIFVLVSLGNSIIEQKFSANLTFLKNGRPTVSK